MQIIDAHLHLFAHSPEGTPEGAAQFQKRCEELGIVRAVVMGNGPLEPEYHRHSGFFPYCIGMDSQLWDGSCLPEDALALVEANFRQPNCVGVKLYPGYLPSYVSDPVYGPLYALARDYHKPVAIHMGMTAMSQAKLKYSHPLTLDEAAADWPDVQFVMCHFGNPFLPDAAAVLEKNPNVAADLSGLLEGVIDLDRYFDDQSSYVSMLRGWLKYVEHPEKFMYGTDYPAVDPANYLEFVQRLVPENWHQGVFFENANRIYQLGL